VSLEPVDDDGGANDERARQGADASRGALVAPVRVPVKSVERAALVMLALSALGAAGIALVVWPRLFDSTPAGIGRLVSARCMGEPDTPCAVSTLAVSAGRYWVEAGAEDPDRLSLEFALPPSGEPARVLLLGVESSFLVAAVEHARPLAGWQPVVAQELGGRSRRRLLRLSGIASGEQVRVTLERVGRRAESADRLRVEEVGLFASEAGLLTDARGFLREVPDRELYEGLLAGACLWLAGLGSLGAFLAASSRGAAAARAAFVLLLTLAVTSLALWLEHNPYWYRTRDVRVMLASGPVQHGIGANLNYGMHLGSRLLQGEGVTFGPRRVPWERMPGYAFFGALAGLVAGFKTDIFTIGLVSIELHLLLLALANAVFAAAAARVTSPGLAVAAAVLVAFMPNQLANTQADSVMVAVYLLTAAALCLYIDRERRSVPPPLPYHLLVHLSFALWFLMRPEGVVGWAAVSAILCFRHPRYLALFAALYLAIGVSWALYKRQYTGEFSMTTNTVGDNAWISLWQAPNDKFRWRTADESYFEFESHLDAPSTSKRASDLVFREVVRFAATYPVYFAHVALHKFVRFVDFDVFTGGVSFPRAGYERLVGPATWLLMGVVALSLSLPYGARRAILLGWPLFLNLPLFLVFYSAGMRHTAPVTASLLVTAVVALGEPGFYGALATRRRHALGVVAAFVVLWFVLHWADSALLASDRWRYWTPFLDPAPFEWYLL
jgi:hypothetical protein